MPSSIVVIGGGITGLSAAYFIAQKVKKPFQLILLEGETHLGGQIGTLHQDGWIIEQGPESFVRYKPAAAKLCEVLGLSSALIRPNAEHGETFILQNKILHKMPEGVFSPFSIPFPHLIRAFAGTSTLSIKGKLRLLFEPFVPRRLDEEESLEHFVTRRLGLEFYENLLGPLVSGIYGGSPVNLSAPTVLGEAVEAERGRGSIALALLANWLSPSKSGRPRSTAGRSVFVTLKNGLSVLLDAMAKQIGPERIRLGWRVQKIDQAEKRFRIKGMNGETIAADYLVLSTPTEISAALVGDLDDDLAAALRKIPYASTTVVSLGFHRADLTHLLRGYGFIVPPREKLSFTACTWSSSKWPHRAPAGEVLLRVYVPGVVEDSRTLVRQIVLELTPLLGIKGKPILTQVTPHPSSLPQYQVGHDALVSQIFKLASRHPGLHLAGAAYHGVGIPDCVASAEKAVDQLMADVQRVAPSSGRN